MHNLKRFEQLARAHCPAGPLDLVHVVVKIVDEKASSEKIFMLHGDFLMVHLF